MRNLTPRREFLSPKSCLEFFLFLIASQVLDPTIGHTAPSSTSSPPQRAQASQDRTPEGAKGRVSLPPLSAFPLFPPFSPSFPPFPFSPYCPFLPNQ
ncbi:hypothetical protein K443DRAFT_675363 [Laccaria amethystina LaAM-08-1]|uniref:Uncharacterized protein n=1 Tax=Laccaria amethystina LaAM-08-1 TaxID=1095629 RepID=A0A0C9XJ68_9AGAR|nr:hypothetical protein K443DRAFT_675363 [Laccaria amethystina LaAM-08-1]